MSETATATVSALFFYPVKSTRGTAVARARLAPTGFEWDRQWMIVDASARFLTQRTHPHMARIVPQVSEGDLTLRHPELPDLRVPREQGGAPLTVRIWDDICEAIGQGSEADTWLTHALGQPVRLVRAQPQMRAANAQYAAPTPAPIGFPDGYPVLVCNTASLADLNTRLPQPMPMERFRPNVVLEGLPAWAEDRIAALTVGPVTLRLVKPCLRCSIPSFDHLTGEQVFNVLPVLKRFRFNRALRGVMFGENAVIEQGTGEELRRGDAVRIHWRN